MKNKMAIITLILIFIIFGYLAVYSLDRHMYPNLNVVGVEDGIMTVELDKGLTLGSDYTCRQAALAIRYAARQSGLRVKVKADKHNNWSPLTQQIWDYDQIMALLNSDAPY